MLLARKLNKEKNGKTGTGEPEEHLPVKVVYESNPVAIPPDFLTVPPDDLSPITAFQIDWFQTMLPQNGTRYAVVLDNVISPSECATLLALAESSVPVQAADSEAEHARGSMPGKTASPWQPARVRAGRGYEVRLPEYRNSDRFIWHQQEVVNRLWNRIAQAPGVIERLAVVEDDDVVLGPPQKKGMRRRWEFRNLLDRMTFLKYTSGQFFRGHCDGSHHEARDDDRIMLTLFTVHLYLNDSVAEVGGSSDLVGGATSFLSSDGKKKVDVNPKAGRVLIFQHRGLYHSGDDVFAGTKYTVRTDMVYEMIKG